MCNVYDAINKKLRKGMLDYLVEHTFRFLFVLPEASFGLQSLACPCDNSSIVQAKITTFGSEM